jgi:hypothetical protein
MSSRGCPPTPNWLLHALKVNEQLNAALARTIARQSQVASDAVSNALRQYQDAATAALRQYHDVVLPGIAQAADQLRRAWAAFSPDNWQDFDIDVIDASADSGINLVWVPRMGVIEQIVAAEPPDRYAVLVRNKGAILDDLSAVLDQAGGCALEGHTDACAFAAEAITAARCGHWSAAQALTACGVGPIVHETYGHRLLADARKQFEKRNIDEATMQIIKVTLLELAAARALRRTQTVSPQGFNRNATQHGMREFFSESNAMAGMLLLVGWLRELKWWTDRAPDHRKLEAN